MNTIRPQTRKCLGNNRLNSSGDCFVITRHQRVLLRSPYHILIFSLAITDMLTGKLIVYKKKKSRLKFQFHLEKTGLKGHSQLLHMRIRYHFLADLRITSHASETESKKGIQNTLNKPCRVELFTSRNSVYRHFNIPLRIHQWICPGKANGYVFISLVIMVNLRDFSRTAPLRVSHLFFSLSFSLSFGYCFL